MANLDSPLGFTPVTMVGGIIPARLYQIDADGSTAMYIGDLVVRAADGNIDLATAGTGNTILGAIIATYDSDMVPTTNRPASTAGFALVADDPAQEFLAQEDSVGSNLALADRGGNTAFVAGTGDTFNNRSGHEIDSSNIGTGAGNQLRIVDIHDVNDNAVGANAQWIVKINNHQALQGIVGSAI